MYADDEMGAHIDTEVGPPVSVDTEAKEKIPVKKSLAWSMLPAPFNVRGRRPSEEYKKKKMKPILE